MSRNQEKLELAKQNLENTGTFYKVDANNELEIIEFANKINQTALMCNLREYI